MGSLKRAKWIEGITQSNRILRDIAEVVTSAIKTDGVIAPEENWELVHPRPYKEEQVVRGTTIQDTTNTRKYTPTTSREEVRAVLGTTAITLIETDIIADSVVVKNEENTVTYVAGTDYVYTAANRTIARTAGSSIPDGSKIRVSYLAKFFKILDTVPVVVERILTVNEPNRIIDRTQYSIDYEGKKITLLNAPGSDTEYMALTFTEVTGIFGRIEHELLKLDKDLLDPDGKTFRLPAGYGEICPDPDVRLVASAVSGGTVGASTGAESISYTLSPTGHSIDFTAGAPTLLASQKMYINVYEYTDVTKSATRKIRVQVVKDTSGSASSVYKMVGTFNELNPAQPHSVEVETDATSPQLFKHLYETQAGYKTLEPYEYILDYNTPTVTTTHDFTEKIVVTCTARGEEDLQTGLDKITDRVVLRTTTEAEHDFSDSVSDQFGAKDTKKNMTMYVEFQKPPRLVNPETGLERYTNHKGVQIQTQLNNHYILARMFDRWDDANKKPAGTIYDGSGNVIDNGAHISEWSKYAWFKDWKEYMIDELDEDAGVSNVNDGLIFKEVVTNGMTEEFPVQFWLSTNNNRLAIILMGDPTLDQDNFLTSFGYFGRIHPFYDSKYVAKRNGDGTLMLDTNGDPILEEVREYFQNDVAGNFALTVGSSTLPAAIGTPPKGVPIMDTVELNQTGGVLTPGQLYDKTAFAYMVTYLTEIGESRPTPVDAGRLIVPGGLIEASSQVPRQGISIKLKFQLPDEATGYRVYRYHKASVTSFDSNASNYPNFKLVTSVDKLERSRTIEYVDEGNALPMYKEIYDSATDTTNIELVNDTSNALYATSTTAISTARSFESVKRDKFTGAILDVKFSSKFGKDTGTGVNDIMMYQTRSGLKFQKHQPSFITTDEFMKKEKSGQSRWTGKFHLSPVYVEHSYDKQRGWLDGVMAVDDSGIEHLDELIVDKDTADEEVYKFFRVNAPFSMFSGSPNYAYGVAIIKTSMKWTQ